MVSLIKKEILLKNQLITNNIIIKNLYFIGNLHFIVLKSLHLLKPRLIRTGKNLLNKFFILVGDYNDN